jgi:hypothetical protein
MADILMQVFQVGFFAALIRIATPLILATIGELYAERSGVLNLGIEGTMLLGAMAGFTTALFHRQLVARGRGGDSGRHGHGPADGADDGDARIVAACLRASA